MILLTLALKYILKLDAIHIAWFFFPKTNLVILVLLWFHINCIISIPISVKNKTKQKRM